MSNKYSFGLKNVHYALASLDVNNTWIYQTPKQLIGAQEFSAEVIGGKTEVYADDQIIGTLVSQAGANLTLKLSEVSDEFKIDILGWIKDNSGNLFEITNSETKTFALGFEIQGDNKARRIWYYLCSASPISDSTKTKTDSPEINSAQINITARPIEVSGKTLLRRIANNGDSNYATFLTNAPELPLSFGV